MFIHHLIRLCDQINARNKNKMINTKKKYVENCFVYEIALTKYK